MKTHQIIFEDGRKGTQTTDADGTLTEIVVTRRADGTRCEDLYGPVEYLDARVFAFSRLHGVKWTIAETTPQEQ